MVEQNIELFLNYLKSRINTNLDIQENEILNEFSQKHGIKNMADINRQIFKDIYGLEYLKIFIEDSNICEIILHDNKTIQIEKNGKLQTEKLDNLNKIIFIYSLETFALRNKVSWNFSNPFTSFYTTFGDFSFRATLVHESLSPNKTNKLFLRRINKNPFPIQYFGLGLREEIELKKLIHEKKNILLAGAGGSGKSSLLASLVDQIPSEEHIIILEDTHEISLNKENFTYFLGNDFLPNKSLRDLCSFSLRLRPDRIILGEIRAKEIIPFVLAMNTGHKGLLSTIHADSGVEAISRMALLFLINGNYPGLTFEMAVKLMSKNIDIVIYLKDRRIKEMIRIIGSDKGVVSYDYFFKNNLS